MVLSPKPWLLPVELFKTDQKYYILDANYVVFLEVNEIVFKIVSILRYSSKNIQELSQEIPEYSHDEVKEALKEIEQIQTQGYLKLLNFQRANPYTLPDIKKYLTSELKGLFLNITSRCNLSCSYCIYRGDYTNLIPLQQQTMTWDIAQKAINFFLPQATETGPLRLDFFGGEPLLAFPLMTRIVDTLKEKILQRNQEIEIFISSNGTVMNDKIIDFLIKHNVLLQVSIDGEKGLHDLKRKFKANNSGSFDIIMKNLQFIFDRNVDYFKNRVKLKAVITTESLKISGADFLKIPLIEILHDQKGLTLVIQSPHYNIKEDEDFFCRIHYLGKTLIQKRDISSIDQLTDNLDYKNRSLFFKTFYEFFTMQFMSRLYYGLADPIPFFKDCLIGIEGCVNVDGSISICCKSNSFIIGNVIENTWHFDKINKFHKKRYSVANQCKYCFIQRFCKFCYEKITVKKGKINSSIRNFCEFNRYYYRLIIEYMLVVMENNPNLWDELPRMAENEKKLLKKKNA